LETLEPERYDDRRMSAKLARSHHGKTGRGPVSGSGRSLFKVGDILAGKYRVERLLGEGGMGVVVEAYHELLDQRVAVKLLYHDVADREAQSRLLMEARSAAKIQSEHVTRVIDVDVGPDGLPFIVMELLEGGDLCQLADARGALPRWLVVDYILQALEGLAHAHGRGIIHRDLKPSNLFLANKVDGTQIIKILDFGISKSTEDGGKQKLTGGGGVLGSPPYMSPEQVRAPKTIDHRSDIWAIGVCMYELLTNSMPFGGEEIQETFAQILEKQPAPITRLIDGVPEGLDAIVMKCLAKNRDDRFMDVAELARAIAPYGSGAWMQAPDRIQATLARALMEDISSSSGTRLRGPHSSARLHVASVPTPTQALNQRRLDAQELHGTANTVLVGAKPKGRLAYVLVAVFVALAVVGVGLFGVVYIRNRPPPVSQDEPNLAVEPPSAVDPTLAAPAPSETAMAPAAPPAGSIIGVSSPMPTDVTPSSVAGKPASRALSPATHQPPPSSPHPVPMPAAPTGGAKRPLGLPDTRQ
jgi:serine/threonine-protein kinase